MSNNAEIEGRRRSKSQEEIIKEEENNLQAAGIPEKHTEETIQNNNDENSANLPKISSACVNVESQGRAAVATADNDESTRNIETIDIGEFYYYEKFVCKIPVPK